MNDERPWLSVILMVDRQRARGARCLASILGQAGIEGVEVVLFDLATHDAPPLPGADHPSVRVISYPRGRSGGRARVEGVQLARAPIVAFVEEHVVVFPEWARGLRAAFRGPYAGVGGEVHNGNPGRGISDALGLINYPRWVPPADRAESVLLPTNNAAYRRDVLLSYGRRLELLLGSDLLLQWQLQRDGHRMLIDPAVKFAHTNETTLRSICRGVFFWNRMCAPRRARLYHWPAARVVVYVWLSPLIPWIRLGRALRYFATKRPRYCLDAIRSAPIMLAVQTAAVVGQTVGLLAGVGDADARFLDYELNQDRGETGRASKAAQ